mmetsp:Transcript_10791/g.32755  ORF Transcript_10791/g.32755 Transcript_10791/m.32755 type:complete len:230 (-) Transcript_10791:526-1215(-)
MDNPVRVHLAMVRLTVVPLGRIDPLVRVAQNVLARDGGPAHVGEVVVDRELLEGPPEDDLLAHDVVLVAHVLLEDDQHGAVAGLQRCAHEGLQLHAELLLALHEPAHVVRRVGVDDDVRSAVLELLRPLLVLDELRPRVRGRAAEGPVVHDDGVVVPREGVDELLHPKGPRAVVHAVVALLAAPVSPGHGAPRNEDLDRLALSGSGNESCQFRPHPKPKVVMDAITTHG